MLNSRNATRTTKHTCGGPVFGQKTPGCPRCDELLAGAAPVQWAGSRRREQEALDRRWAAEHFASAEHNDPRHPLWCGPVCTYGEW